MNIETVLVYLVLAPFLLIGIIGYSKALSELRVYRYRKYEKTTKNELIMVGVMFLSLNVFNLLLYLYDPYFQADYGKSAYSEYFVLYGFLSAYLFFTGMVISSIFSFLNRDYTEETEDRETN